MTFATEQKLVDRFVDLIRSNRTPWGELRFSREFDYARGRTDIVAVARADDTLIAFEAKLKNWRQALQQAYRNTCFAHQSYVLLPKATALLAASCIGEFERRRVGLCYVEDDCLKVLQDSPHTSPLEPWLSTQAMSHVELAEG